MLSKLPCGCKHDDTHWIVRCAACQTWDDEVSARWAAQRANPPTVTVHRINGVVVQNAAFVTQPVDEVSPEVQSSMKELVCPEPTPPPTNGSETSATTEPQTDYSELLSLL